MVEVARSCWIIHHAQERQIRTATSDVLNKDGQVRNFVMIHPERVQLGQKRQFCVRRQVVSVQNQRVHFLEMDKAAEIAMESKKRQT